MSTDRLDAPLLAFDTSEGVGSVAVGRGGSVLVERSLGERTQHARLLLQTVAALLSECGIAREDLTGVVVGAGPGSFTGVRVAAATAKGLCHALAIPLHPVSSLKAAAWGLGVAQQPDALRAVLFDARADRVFAGFYRIRGGRLEEDGQPAATTVDGALSRRMEVTPLAMGSGARRHAEPIRQAGWQVLDSPWGDPLASSLLKVHWQDLESGAASSVNPASWKPVYLKDSSASPPR